jgi:hypothetical protein
METANGSAFGKRHRFLVVLVTLGLAACDAGHESSDAGTADSVSADTDDVEVLLGELYGDLPGETRYFEGEADLDGDGRAERIVHVAGPMVCGTGGCTTLVFMPAEDGWRQVAGIGVNRPPIRVSARSTNGWRNLIVHVAGGGLQDSYEAELRFDGETYPDNPTVPPAERAADVEGARVLIDEFESFTEGKPLPAR